jgi:hypothetical protein
VVARNCYYGLSFQENGDDLAGDLTTINCRRSYFPYGVRRHNLQLEVRHNGAGPGADACILIKRYGRDTGDITVRAHFSGVLAWRSLVNLSQDPSGGQTGTIDNIDIRLDVNPTVSDPYGAARLAISAYRGGREVADSPDIWRNVRLSGCMGRSAEAPVVYRTRAPRAGRVDVTQVASTCA